MLITLIYILASVARRQVEAMKIPCFRSPFSQMRTPFPRGRQRLASLARLFEGSSSDKRRAVTGRWGSNWTRGSEEKPPRRTDRANSSRGGKWRFLPGHVTVPALRWRRPPPPCCTGQPGPTPASHLSRADVIPLPSTSSEKTTTPMSQAGESRRVKATGRRVHTPPPSPPNAHRATCTRTSSPSLRPPPPISLPRDTRSPEMTPLAGLWNSFTPLPCCVRLIRVCSGRGGETKLASSSSISEITTTPANGPLGFFGGGEKRSQINGRIRRNENGL